MSYMKFWDNHAALRVALLLVFFALGFAGIFSGLALQRLLSGVLLMLAGLAFLLAALWLYNQPFTDAKKKNKKI